MHFVFPENVLFMLDCFTHSGRIAQDVCLDVIMTEVSESAFNIPLTIFSSSVRIKHMLYGVTFEERHCNEVFFFSTLMGNSCCFNFEGRTWMSPNARLHQLTLFAKI